jgi:hypothetical protein
MQIFRLAAFAALLPLFGCGEDDFAANGVEQARAVCEDQGKQFILKETPKVTSGELLERDVEVVGVCVGPGEPGYKPPKG